MSEPAKYTIHTQSSQIIEHNSGTVIGIQNSHSNAPEVQGAIADLQTRSRAWVGRAGRLSSNRQQPYKKPTPLHSGAIIALLDSLHPIVSTIV